MRGLKIYSGPEGWGWVRLRDLAKKLRLSPEETWKNYFNLTKDLAYKTLAWRRCLSGELLQSDEIPPEDEEFSSMFVPAGWAQDVIRAHRLGAVRVIVIPHEHRGDEVGPHGCPPGTLACHFAGGPDFLAAVGVNSEGTPIAPVPKLLY